MSISEVNSALFSPTQKGISLGASFKASPQTLVGNEKLQGFFLENQPRWIQVCGLVVLVAVDALKKAACIVGHTIYTIALASYVASRDACSVIVQLLVGCFFKKQPSSQSIQAASKIPSIEPAKTSLPIKATPLPETTQHKKQGNFIGGMAFEKRGIWKQKAIVKIPSKENLAKFTSLGLGALILGSGLYYLWSKKEVANNQNFSPYLRKLDAGQSDSFVDLRSDLNGTDVRSTNSSLDVCPIRILDKESSSTNCERGLKSFPLSIQNIAKSIYPNSTFLKKQVGGKKDFCVSRSVSIFKDIFVKICQDPLEFLSINQSNLLNSRVSNTIDIDSHLSAFEVKNKTTSIRGSFFDFAGKNSYLTGIGLGISVVLIATVVIRICFNHKKENQTNNIISESEKDEGIITQLEDMKQALLEQEKNCQALLDTKQRVRKFEEENTQFEGAFVELKALQERFAKAEKKWDDIIAFFEKSGETLIPKGEMKKYKRQFAVSQKGLGVFSKHLEGLRKRTNDLNLDDLTLDTLILNLKRSKSDIERRMQNSDVFLKKLTSWIQEKIKTTQEKMNLCVRDVTTNKEGLKSQLERFGSVLTKTDLPLEEQGKEILSFLKNLELLAILKEIESFSEKVKKMQGTLTFLENQEELQQASDFPPISSSVPKREEIIELLMGLNSIIDSIKNELISISKKITNATKGIAIRKKYGQLEKRITRSQDPLFNEVVQYLEDETKKEIPLLCKKLEELKNCLINGDLEGKTKKNIEDLLADRGPFRVSLFLKENALECMQNMNDTQKNIVRTLLRQKDVLGMTINNLLLKDKPIVGMELVRNLLLDKEMISEILEQRELRAEKVARFLEGESPNLVEIANSIAEDQERLINEEEGIIKEQKKQIENSVLPSISSLITKLESILTELNV